MSGKIAVIGLDGASFNIIDAFSRSKMLPNIASLLEKGKSYHLTSTIPSNTPVAWTSMATGVNPGKHGIFGFFKYDEDDLKLVSSSDIRSMFVWDLLKLYGKTSLIINVPFTWPPQEINGAIACFDSSPAGTGNKKQILAEPPFVDKYIKEHHFDRIAAFHVERSVHGINRFKEIVQLETDFTIEMCNHFDWDLLFIVFMITDHVMHMYPLSKYHRTKVYEIVDEAIGRLLELVDLNHDHIFITSDHGTKGFTRGYPIPAFLRKQKLLYLKPFLNKRALLYYMGKEFVKDVLYDVSQLFDVDLNILIKALPKFRRNTDKNRKRKKVKFTLRNLINKEESPLLYCSENSGIDILLKINEKLYSRDLKQQFLQIILKNVNSDKRNIIKRAWISEELYSGPYLSNAPDLILEMNSDLGAIEDPLSYYRKIQITPFIKGGHTRRGIFIAAGKDISHDSIRSVASICDVTPTILHSMCLPIPKDMDGEVLMDLYDTRSVLYNSPEYVDIDLKKHIVEEIEEKAYTIEEEEEMKIRLQRLGYL